MGESDRVERNFWSLQELFYCFGSSLQLDDYKVPRHSSFLSNNNSTSLFLSLSLSLSLSLFVSLSLFFSLSLSLSFALSLSLSDRWRGCAHPIHRSEREREIKREGERIACTPKQNVRVCGALQAESAGVVTVPQLVSQSVRMSDYYVNCCYLLSCME
jgi:hypothetical protein